METHDQYNERMAAVDTAYAAGKAGHAAGLTIRQTEAKYAKVHGRAYVAHVARGWFTAADRVK